MTTAVAFAIRALPIGVLDAVRSGGPDASGTPAVLVEASGGEPLRCCLRDAVAGEPLLLFGYRPPTADGPYVELGPVFAHAEPCPAYDGRGYPRQWLGRPQVLRAYDDRGWVQVLPDPDEPVVHLYAEGKTPELSEELVAEVTTAVEAVVQGEEIERRTLEQASS